MRGELAGSSSPSTLHCRLLISPLAAGVFLGLGLSGVVPTMHFTIAEGFVKATTVGQMGWFFLMAVMYITGAGLYAARIPERFFPGKFDIWVSVGTRRGAGSRVGSLEEEEEAGGVLVCPSARAGSQTLEQAGLAQVQGGKRCLGAMRGTTWG